MIPIAGSIITTNPVQTPLINTALPGTTIVHVPYDNVAPSVSNAQVNNNARGNSGGANASEAEQPAILTGSGATFSPLARGDAANLAPAAQATFIAQLLSQGVPISGLLMEYEKLVVFSNVKYKPSNALKPAPAPAGVFGRILQQEKSVPVRAPEVSLPQPTEAPPVTLEKTQAIEEVPVIKTEPKTEAPIVVKAPVKLPTSITTVVTQAINAYQVSTQRNASIEAEPITDLA